MHLQRMAILVVIKQKCGLYLSGSSHLHGIFYFFQCLVQDISKHISKNIEIKKNNKIKKMCEFVQ